MHDAARAARVRPSSILSPASPEPTRRTAPAARRSRERAAGREGLPKGARTIRRPGRTLGIYENGSGSLWHRRSDDDSVKSWWNGGS